MIFQGEDCKKSVQGYPNEYKSFKTLDEANQYLNISASSSKDKRIHETKDYVPVYTDGACINNGKKGASGGIGVWWGPNDPRNISEKLNGLQTNNRAELTAAIRGLESAGKDINVAIHTDSKYTIRGIEEWIKKWKKNGWKTLMNKDVLNKDLWIMLDRMILERRGCTKWVHVKGHSNIVGNEEADALAKAAVYS